MTDASPPTKLCQPSFELTGGSRPTILLTC